MKRIILPFFFIFTSINFIEAQTATVLSISDTRSVNDLPNFSTKSIKADFKRRSEIGVPGSGVYSTNVTVSPWLAGDNTGGKNHQLNFNDGGVFYRNAFPLDAKWGEWKQFVLTNEKGTIANQTANNNYNENLRLLPSTSNDYSSIALGAIAGDSGTGIGQWSIVRHPAANGYMFSLKYNNTDYFNILNSGNIGIGITDPKNKLDVNGTIHSKEVKVDMQGWSDFVFKKEYDLPTLAQVEKHINENGHLENIPNEEEVLKNGINLGEMNAKLLQKIEELTLYSIQQAKEIEVLKEENKSFKTLSERLAKIEQKLN